MTQDIRNQNGQIIGQIRTRGNVQDIYDMFGRKLGYFDGRYTFDATGRKIGDGNLLTFLLNK